MSLRATLDYTPLTRAEAEPTACAVVTGPGCRAVGTDARFYAVTGDVVIHPRAEAERAHPYFTLGLGIKRYEFGGLSCDPDDIVCLLLDEFARNQTNMTFHVAVGLNLPIGPFSTQVEVGDYMSRFRPGGVQASGEVQQDVFVTVGVRVRLR
jgi:hypothetical protein